MTSLEIILIVAFSLLLIAYIISLFSFYSLRNICLDLIQQNAKICTLFLKYNSPQNVEPFEEYKGEQK